MLPAIGASLVGGAIWFLVRLFTTQPTRENNTIHEIGGHMRRQERRDEQREREARAEKERILADRDREIQAERERIFADTESVLAELQAEKQRQSEEMMRRNRQSSNESEREAERLAAIYKEKEKKIRDEQQRLQEYEKKIKANEQALAEETRKVKELAETARLCAENGHLPDIWPTRDEYEKGRELIQYNRSNLHFAIIGKSGSGKSSLINAFLNLKQGEPGAALTGTTETTSEIGRYPDPGEQLPRPWTIWYDVPGAGTQTVSARQYFINQGLFVFDIILLAIGDRFEETDVQLLKDCQRFNIPTLIVRSKADMHISNLIKEKVGQQQPPSKEIYQSCREVFINKSRQMVRDELEKASLLDQEVYLVDSYTLREQYNTSLQTAGSDSSPDVIDEKTLIDNLMLLTIQRRGDFRALQAAAGVTMRGGTLWRTAVAAGRDLVRTVFLQPNPVGQGGGAHAPREGPVQRPRQNRPMYDGGAHTPQVEPVPRPQQNTGNGRPQSERPRHSNRKNYIPWVKHVIYLHRPAELGELQTELERCNPALAPMWAAGPRQLSPKTFVLNFLPGHTIPNEVEAFGTVLALYPFRHHPNTKNTNNSQRPTTTSSISEHGTSQHICWEEV